MASNIPQELKQQQSPSIASFNFTDIASGEGFVSFYGLVSESDSALDYHMIGDSTRKSSNVQTKISVATAPDTKRLDVDFDTSTFNLPRRMRGDAVFNVPIGIIDNAANTQNTYIHVKLRHVDADGTETEIVDGKSDTFSSINSSTLYQKIFSVLLTVPETYIGVGERIRTTIEVWASNNGGSGDVYLGHDPSDRDGETTDPEQLTDSQMVMHIPFVINV